MADELARRGSTTGKEEEEGLSVDVKEATDGENDRENETHLAGQNGIRYLKARSIQAKF